VTGSRREAGTKVGLVALHYPHPEYREEMISRVHRAAEIMATPGCLAVDCWVSDDHQAAVPTAAVDFDYGERESRPRTVFTLPSCR
jgi:hypothetical protein